MPSTTAERRSLVNQLATDVYLYEDLRSSLVGRHRYSGMDVPALVGVKIYSAVNDTSWRLHCTDGVVVVSINGYAKRSSDNDNEVYVLVGTTDVNGNTTGGVSFPGDGAKAQDAQPTGTARLVKCPVNETVDWEARVSAMATVLTDAKAALETSIGLYNAENKTREENQAADDQTAAVQAVAAV